MLRRARYSAARDSQLAIEEDHMRPPRQSTQGWWYVALCMATITLMLATTAAGAGRADGAATASSPTRVTIDVGAEMSDVDVLLGTGGDTMKIIAAGSVYEGLTQRQGSAIVPALATAWKQRGNAWIFTLRKGVRFANGRRLSAADVVASWTRAVSEKSFQRGANVSTDTVVKALNNSTVSISRPVADPTIPARAALIQIAPADWAALSDNRMATQMMGTGPYAFVEWRRGRDLTLAANAHYWGPKPSITDVKIRFDVEPAVRLAALQAGEIQMALNMSPELIKPGFRADAYDASEVAFIRLNTLFGPTKDIRVRQAISLAIDRNLIIKTIYRGYASPAHGQIVTRFVTGFNPKLKNDPYNPAKARQLLERANAVGTTLELWATKGRWTKDDELAQAVAQMLDKVGLNVVLQQPEFSKWIETSRLAGKPGGDAELPALFIWNTSNELFDASRNMMSLLPCDGAASAVCSQPLERLLKAQDRELNPTKRQALWNKIFAIGQQQSLYIAIASVKQLTFVAKNLTWKPQPAGWLRYQDMAYVR